MPRYASMAIAIILAVSGLAAAGPIEPVSRDRGARKAPATRGKLAPLMPVTPGRHPVTPGLQPVTPGLRPVTSGRAAGLKPITSGRLAPIMPVTRGRAAGLAPVTRGRAAGLAPVTTGRAAGLAPVSSGRASGLAPVSTGRASGLAPVTSGRAAGLSPVSSGRASGLAPMTTGRASGLAPMTLDRGGSLDGMIFRGTHPPVITFDNGYLAPYEARHLVRGGEFSESLLRVDARRGARLRRAGVGSVYRRPGDVRAVLDTLDPYGPHRHGLKPLGQNVPAGVRVGSMYFPAAYYIRPGGARDRRRAPGARLILIARDLQEDMPEDFRRRLQKSNFPMVMGDVAFKAGNYVQATLAFQDAADRRPTSAAAHIAFADALIALRNYRYAAEELRAGLTIAPSWVDDLDRHGVYGKEGHLEKHLSEVEELSAVSGGAKDAWFLLGYLQMTSGSPEGKKAAAVAFRKALDRDPNDILSARYLDALTR